MLAIPSAIIFLLLFAPADVPPTKAALFEGRVDLKAECVGVHPRLYATPDELKSAAERYRRDPAFFASMIPDEKSRIFKTEPTPLDKGENAAGAGRVIMRLAVLYRVTGDEKYRRAMEAWTPAMEAFTPLRYERVGGVGNRDLTSGALMCSFATAYDLCKGAVDERTEKALRNVVVSQARASFDDLGAMKSYPYEQNHLTIPVSGLAIAAMAVMDEEPDAKRWLVFSHNVLDRCLDAVAYDGWFFEGVSYWNYTMQYPLLYASALRRTTGEDLFQHRFFKGMSVYLPHMFLPGGTRQFDFADWGPRVNADGKTAQKGYELPWHTMKARLFSYVPLYHEMNDPLLRATIASIVPQLDPKDATDIDQAFAMLWPERIEAAKVAEPPPAFHHFNDMDVVHWRQNWTDPNATAIAFKSGPPAGHHITSLYPLYPEWKPSIGHAHPDAGSFILFSRGVFLANDTGYGVKESKWHNTMTIDGVGQGKGGTPWATWVGIPYEQLNKIRMTDVWMNEHVVAGTAVFEDAYVDVKVSKARRHLILIDGKFLVIADELEADSPRTYDWFLHTDREPKAVGENRWTMENGGARLVIQDLDAVESSKIEPTVIETELYDKNLSRPQQRGFHLNLRSPQREKFQFLTAMDVQAASESEKSFTAKKVNDHRIELTDGDTSCTVWIGASDECDGRFGFVVRKGKDIQTVGLSGKRLKTDVGTIEIPDDGNVVLRRNGNGWTPIDPNPPKWKLR